VSFSTSYFDPDAKFLYQKIQYFRPKDGEINIKLKGSTGISVIIDTSEFLGDKASRLTHTGEMYIKYNKPKAIRLGNLNNTSDYEEVSLWPKAYNETSYTRFTYDFYDAFIVKKTSVKFYLTEMNVEDHSETSKIERLELDVKPGYKNLFVVKLGACGAFLGPNKTTNFRIFMCYNLGGNYYYEGMKRGDIVVGNTYAWGRKTPVYKNYPFYNEKNNPYEDGDIWNESENPCPAGFRVPTISEWKNVLYDGYNPREKLYDSEGIFIGWKIGNNLLFYYSSLWSATNWGLNISSTAYYVSFYSDIVDTTENKYKALPVRCIRKLPHE